MLKFFWNGIKDNGGKLQRCHYSDAMLINYPHGTITIYARDYTRFSPGIQQAFCVENDTEIQSDYIQKDLIRVEPTHPLYGSVVTALSAERAHFAKLDAKRIKQ